jgi:2-polyprenyl-6-methoxyphenol hydroxylase-like FAD-dependent oxidoreductase
MPTTRRLKVLVVGGGIGGLATAAALRGDGHHVEVFERAAALAEVGAGLSMAPNALAALDRLGVGDDIRGRGGIAHRILVRTRSGKILSEIDAAGRDWEVVGVHRVDVQDVLLRAAGDVRLGAGVVGFDCTDDSVTVRLEGGNTAEGDLVIGADGIRSTVRAQLLPEEPLRYAGYVGWRAAINYDDPTLEGRFSESWGPRLRVGLITLGRGRLYWFVSESAPEHAAPPGDSRAYLSGLLDDWHDPIPQVAAATPSEAITRLPIHDRRPVSEWGRGRVTLLGDAAHPMTPNLGQGAAQALEDAIALRDAIGTEADPVRALRAYEAARIPRTTMIVRRSRQLGRVAQLESAWRCRLRDAVVKATPARVQRRQQELVIGPGLYAASRSSSRPSRSSRHSSA